MAKKSEETKLKMREAAITRWENEDAAKVKAIRTKQSEAATAFWAAMSPEDRRERARRSAQKRKENRKRD